MIFQGFSSLLPHQPPLLKSTRFNHIGIFSHNSVSVQKTRTKRPSCLLCFPVFRHHQLCCAVLYRCLHKLLLQLLLMDGGLALQVVPPRDLWTVLTAKKVFPNVLPVSFFLKFIATFSCSLPTKWQEEIAPLGSPALPYIVKTLIIFSQYLFNSLCKEFCMFRTCV